MIATLTAFAETMEVTATLVVQRRDGWRSVYKLSSEQGVLVGTSDNCGLRLEGEGVSAFHCFFSLENGRLWVQDWLSTVGTFVNDERVGAKVALGRDDAIGVGEYRITTQLGTSLRTDVSRSPSRPNDPTAPSASPPRVLDATRDDPPETAAASLAMDVCDDLMDAIQDDPLDPEDDPHDQPANSSSEISAVEEDPPQSDSGSDDLGSAPEADDFEPDNAADAPLPVSFDSFDANLFEADSLEADGFDAETMQLLRAELEELQGELAQRDARIAELTAQRAESPQDPKPREDEDEHSEALVARLEELLDEAARGDERVAVLEESLRAADEANQAENEERQQLEAWVGDIERRIGQREAEWNAEIEALRKRLDETAVERDRAQRQLREAASHGGAPEHYEETLERLRAQNNVLHDKLALTQSERTALAQRLEQLESGNDEALRQERATIAQERAMLSRLRAELSGKMASLEEQPKSREHDGGEFADRLKALRDHLRELHQEDSRECPETTLMSRISRLWKRLD